MADEPVFDLLDDLNREVQAAHQANGSNGASDFANNARSHGDWEHSHLSGIFTSHVLWA